MTFCAPVLAVKSCNRVLPSCFDPIVAISQTFAPPMLNNFALLRSARSVQESGVNDAAGGAHTVPSTDGKRGDGAGALDGATALSQEACTSKPSSPGLVGEGVTLSLGCAPRPPPLHQFLPSCGAADAAWAIGVTVGPFAAARHRRCARSKTRAAACRATTDGQTISVFGEAVDEVAGAANRPALAWTNGSVGAWCDASSWRFAVAAAGVAAEDAARQNEAAAPPRTPSLIALNPEPEPLLRKRPAPSALAPPLATGGNDGGPATKAARRRPQRDNAAARIARRDPLWADDVESLNSDEARLYASAMGVTKRGEHNTEAFKLKIAGWFESENGRDPFIP